MTKNWEKEFDNKELNQLEWCGNEDHECECYQKKDAIKKFISDLLADQKKELIEDIYKKGRETIEWYGDEKNQWAGVVHANTTINAIQGLLDEIKPPMSGHN
jgi:hypothetical protein